MTTANTTEQAELDVLREKLALGTCNGKPASKRQTAARKRRIRELGAAE